MSDEKTKAQLIKELGELRRRIAELEQRGAGQAEEALRESEDKFKYVFDYSVVGKSITLPTGEVHVNKAFCEMLGYSAEELQSKRWQDVSHHDDLAATQREIDSLLSGEKSRHASPKDIFTRMAPWSGQMSARPCAGARTANHSIL